MDNAVQNFHSRRTTHRLGNPKPEETLTIESKFSWVSVITSSALAATANAATQNANTAQPRVETMFNKDLCAT